VWISTEEGDLSDEGLVKWGANEEERCHSERVWLGIR